MDPIHQGELIQHLKYKLKEANKEAEESHKSAARREAACSWRDIDTAMKVETAEKAKKEADEKAKKEAEDAQKAKKEAEDAKKAAEDLASAVERDAKRRRWLHDEFKKWELMTMKGL
eukprot:gnl/TRDRNA2_/TRDRNA2_174848_c0_seq12.p3 gnl/TRDRNA2_/TRDRNA2_174848_c0~~gnl/TRDRNA2_/TRDRNA2_174848_c0_seq12.p3  ORF type:complete len:117 (+),score=49.79 gnl/TRDRNA2_/TRDRNA2_174848_c0_seq12:207-557(+)